MDCLGGSALEQGNLNRIGGHERKYRVYAMATLQDNGYFYCKACGRGDLTREDFFQDKAKKYGLSRLCKPCELERTREAKHQHYLRSEKHKQAMARKTKRAYYLRNKEDMMVKSRAYKRRNPGKIRQYFLKAKYRLTPEEVAAMIEERKGCCEICGTYQGDKLHVDHNHATGKVRGMLCRRCNNGLGMFGDDEELLNKARSYLLYYSE